jgi:hypothetical protein
MTTVQQAKTLNADEGAGQRPALFGGAFARAKTALDPAGS